MTPPRSRAGARPSQNPLTVARAEAYDAEDTVSGLPTRLAATRDPAAVAAVSLGMHTDDARPVQAKAQRGEPALEHGLGIVVPRPLLDHRRVDSPEIRRHLRVTGS